VNHTAAAFDVARFTEWLGQVTGEPAAVRVTPMSGGGSCEMFRVERLGRFWVVRRAPLRSVSDTAHHVVREARVIEALAGTAVPVPTILAIGDDPDVLGAPFFVMSFVDGEVVRRNGLPEALAAQPDSHHAVGEGLIDTLVSLHEVDWLSTPLAELSHPEGFLARQVDRWMTQLESYRSRDLNGIDDVATWLAANQPTRGDLTVMHGDYKLDNVLWSRQPPPRVLSVLDFEMTTVGDPLIDLAWALIFWPEEGNLIALAAPGSPNGIAAEQCQTPAELAQRYAAATGRDLSGFDWYQAFSAWKLAIVLEASYAKFRRGESTNPHHEVFGFVVDELLSRAKRFAQ
jgi:aminoglycoside phosphotransferase (APT) family kinase protein